MVENQQTVELAWRFEKSQTRYVVLHPIQRIAMAAFALVPLTIRYQLRSPCKHGILHGKGFPVGLVLLCLWQGKEEVMPAYHTHTLSASLKSHVFY